MTNSSGTNLNSRSAAGPGRGEGRESPSSLPRYAEYKDSGVAWLGEVPAHWSVERFKWNIERNDGGVWGDEPDGIDDTAVLRSTEQTVDGNWKMVDPAYRKLSADERAAALLESGDLLLTKSSGSSLHIGKTTLVNDEIANLGCCYSNFMQRLRTNKRIAPEVAWYFLNNELSRLQFDLLSNSTTGLANLNGSMIGELMVAVAPREEQSGIAAFLDRETGKIDALIAEQEKLLTLLAEKCQATISHAVTRGLNPNAPMKDSGVPWLGAVPAHWTITRLKFVAVVQTGIAKGKDTQGKETITVPYLRVANVQDGHLALDEVAMIDIEPEQLDRYRLQAGDVLMNEGGDFDKLGRGAIWNAEIEDCIHQNHVFAVRPHAVSPQWLNQITGSQYAQFYFMGRSKQSTNLASISSTNVMELPVLLPPAEEQVSILAFVDNESARLDALYASSVQAIALLKERRSTLIAAAVTGKIDVRGVSQTMEEGCA